MTSISQTNKTCQWSGASKERFASESSWTWMFDQRRCLWKCVGKNLICPSKRFRRYECEVLKQVEAAAALHQLASFDTSRMLPTFFFILAESWDSSLCVEMRATVRRSVRCFGQLPITNAHQSPETREIVVKHQTCSPEVVIVLNKRGHQSASCVKRNRLVVPGTIRVSIAFNNILRWSEMLKDTSIQKHLVHFYSGKHTNVPKIMVKNNLIG